SEAPLHLHSFPTRRSSDLVMEKLGMAVDRLGEADAPQRCGAPFTAAGLELWAMVTQPLAHVVQQQVGVRTNGLVGQFRLGSIGRSEEHTSELQSRENLVCR